MKKAISALMPLILVVTLFTSCSMTVTKTDNTTVQSSDAEQSQSTVSADVSAAQEDITSDSGTATTLDSSTKANSAASNNISGSTTEKGNNQTQTKKNEQATKADEPSKAAEQVTCSIEISCATILKNMDNLNESKKSFVPTSGTILKKTNVSVPEGSTVFDVLKKACKDGKCIDNCAQCKKAGIQLEFNWTPAYQNYYIEGIHQIYEKDCGDNSGWMYSVNGVFPNYGCSSYKVKSGDTIKWLYTCDLGEDIGA
jgi:hypothetical protein